MYRGKDLWTVTLLLTLTAAVSLWMRSRGAASFLEVFSFVTGALCVWLTVKQSIWNFPISLINVTAFCFVFFKARLFGDAALQLVYFVLTIHGWYLWMHGGEHRGRLSVSRIPSGEAIAVATVGIFVTIAMTIYFRHIRDSAPFLDALTTSLSLCAQYMLNRKYLENWLCWIAADVIYIPLYFHKDLRLTSLLYILFLSMCVIGLREWRRSYLQTRVEIPEAAIA